MKKVLVNPETGSCHDVVAADATFEFAPPFIWVDVPDDYVSSTTYGYSTYANGVFTWVETASAEDRLNNLRSVRNKKLAQCDWVVAKYTELGQPIPAEWATYRQALRDITNVYTSVEDVVWPITPENS